MVVYLLFSFGDLLILCGTAPPENQQCPKSFSPSGVVRV
jgi:hypothetical protein